MRCIYTLLDFYSAVKHFAGNYTIVAMETEEDYVAFVLCILCIVILRWRSVLKRLTCYVQRIADFLFLKSLFLYSFDLIFHIISFSSIRSMSLDVTVSVHIKSVMISSCSNISPPNNAHVLLFTMLLPEILLLLIGYLMVSLISYH